MNTIGTESMKPTASAELYDVQGGLERSCERVNATWERITNALERLGAPNLPANVATGKGVAEDSSSALGRLRAMVRAFDDLADRLEESAARLEKVV